MAGKWPSPGRGPLVSPRFRGRFSIREHIFVIVRSVPRIELRRATDDGTQFKGLLRGCCVGSETFRNVALGSNG